MKTITNLSVSATKATRNTSATQSFIRQLANTLPVRTLANQFSSVMDEQITPLQALCIINAIVALIVTVFSLAVPLPFRLFSFAWLFLSLRQCKACGLGDEE